MPTSKETKKQTLGFPNKKKKDDFPPKDEQVKILKIDKWLPARLLLHLAPV